MRALPRHGRQVGVRTGGQRISHAIFDGATSGLSTTTQNGSFVYGNDLILRYSVESGAEGPPKTAGFVIPNTMLLTDVYSP